MCSPHVRSRPSQQRKWYLEPCKVRAGPHRLPMPITRRTFLRGAVSQLHPGRSIPQESREPGPLQEKRRCQFGDQSVLWQGSAPTWGKRQEKPGGDQGALHWVLRSHALGLFLKHKHTPIPQKPQRIPPCLLPPLSHAANFRVLCAARVLALLPFGE